MRVKTWGIQNFTQYLGARKKEVLRSSLRKSNLDFDDLYFLIKVVTP